MESTFITSSHFPGSVLKAGTTRTRMVVQAETDESSLITAAHLVWGLLNPASHEKDAWKKKDSDRKICLIYRNNVLLSEYKYSGYTMRNRDAYKKKIYTELELVQARFAQFKAQGQNFDTATRARHDQHVEKVEQHVITTKAKLKELDAAHDDVWEELVDGVESTWTVLQSTLEDAVTSFED